MIKKLSKSVREYKWPAILTPLLVALEVVMEVLIPTLMADLIDKGIELSDLNQIYTIGGKLIVLAILAFFFGIFSGFMASNASSGFAKNLRLDIFKKIQSFSFANIDKFSSASLITRLTTDVTHVQSAFQMIIRMAVRAPLMLIFSLIMALRINSSFGLMFLVVIPVIGIGLGLIIRKVFPLMTKTFKTYDKLNSVANENIAGIRVVKSYVLEEEEKKKFRNTSNKIYEYFSKAEKLMSLNQPLLQSSIYACIIFISWFGSKMIVESNQTLLTTGELTVLFTYTIQVLTSLMMLSMIFVMLVIARTSANRIVEVLDEKPTIKEPKNGLKEVPNGDIEFNNVGFSYVGKLEKEVLKNINLKIKSGEVIGVIGSTGSSKTSLVNLIPRLYDVTEGEVKVGGHNVKEYDLKSLRDNVAVVLQKNVLCTGTILENIKWGDESASLEDVKDVCRYAQADKFVESFPDKYDTLISEGGTNVSGGQKQRLTIARALLKKPKILILDDSTSAVDTKTDKLIRDALYEKIPNTTKIIIAQRISSVMEADKIIVLDEGKVTGFASHKELLKTNKIYREVYEIQTKGSENNE